MDKELNIKGLNIKHSFRFIAVLIMMFYFLTSSYAALTGTGSPSDPFIIDEPQDLVDLRTFVQKAANQGKYIYVKQTADIDLTDLSKANGRPPVPLAGTNVLGVQGRLSQTSTYFLGEYDGGGYTISNWRLSKAKQQTTVSTKEYPISLFGRVGKDGSNVSKIKNLNIDGFDLEMTQTSSGMNVAPGFSFLVSDAKNTEITNCHIKNSKVYGVGHFSFGAIAASTLNVTITDCSVKNCSFDPTNGSQNVGAFCGSNSGDIKNCFADNVSLNGESYVGGLVGEMNGGTVENCGFNGKIIPSNSINVSSSGGLCGRINKGSFINCFSVFDNDGNTWKFATAFGGLVGEVTENAMMTVKNCYAYTQISVNDADRDNVDFFVGLDNNKEDETKLDLELIGLAAKQKK